MIVGVDRSNFSKSAAGYPLWKRSFWAVHGWYTRHTGTRHCRLPALKQPPCGPGVAGDSVCLCSAKQWCLSTSLEENPCYAWLEHHARASGKHFWLPAFEEFLLSQAPLDSTWWPLAPEEPLLCHTWLTHKVNVSKAMLACQVWKSPFAARRNWVHQSLPSIIRFSS